MFSVFVEPIEDGWALRGPTGGQRNGVCTIGWFEITAVRTGGSLVVDSAEYNAEVPDHECSEDEAERRNTSLPCAGRSVREATIL